MDSLSDLVSKVSNPAKLRSKRSKVFAFWRKPKGRRFYFLVKSQESYSSKAGHIVTILYPTVRIPFSLLPLFPSKTPYNLRVRTYCSCQAWRFTGPSYLSTRDKYRLPEKKFIEERPANIRDPQGEHFICKHVVRVSKWLSSKSFKNVLKVFKAIEQGSDKTSHFHQLDPILESVFQNSLVHQRSFDLDPDAFPGSQPDQETPLSLGPISVVDEQTFEDVLRQQGLSI